MLSHYQLSLSATSGTSAGTNSVEYDALATIDDVSAMALVTSQVNEAMYRKLLEELVFTFKSAVGALGGSTSQQRASSMRALDGLPNRLLLSCVRTMTYALQLLSPTTLSGDKLALLGLQQPPATIESETTTAPDTSADLIRVVYPSLAQSCVSFLKALPGYTLSESSRAQILVDTGRLYFKHAVDAPLKGGDMSGSEAASILDAAKNTSSSPACSATAESKSSQGDPWRRGIPIGKSESQSTAFKNRDGPRPITIETDGYREHRSKGPSSGGVPAFSPQKGDEKFKGKDGRRDRVGGSDPTRRGLGATVGEVGGRGRSRGQGPERGKQVERGRDQRPGHSKSDHSLGEESRSSDAYGDRSLSTASGANLVDKLWSFGFKLISAVSEYKPGLYPRSRLPMEW